MFLRKAAFFIAGWMTIAVIASGQGTDATQIDSTRYTGFLPAIAFRSLIADPNEHQAGTALRSGDFVGRGSLEGIASFGASLPIIGWGSDGNSVQIGAAGGVISRFDMHTSANDLVSEDYEVGFPLWIRSGRLAGRLRVYHRSAHIGDEIVLHNPGLTRFDLTYEAVEGILAANFGEARVYLGGDYIYHNATTQIKPGALRAGADAILGSAFETRSLRARWVGGVDLDASRDLAWRVAKSAVGGLELSRARASSLSMRILIELFDGPSNAGQFYGTSERYVGIAAYVTP